MWQYFITHTLDFIYPTQCELCHTPLDHGSYLCDTCNSTLPRIIEPFCSHCGEMFEGNISDSFTCPNCTDLNYDFAFCRPVLPSSDPARQLIHSLKYGHSIHLAADLARIASEAFTDPRLHEALTSRWTIVPVPLHWIRQQTRHYNQSAEIARHLARILDLPYCDALKRIRATTTQTALSRRQRLKNLKGAFTLSSSGKKWGLTAPTGVILIDDVFTTGATSQECSSILRKNGIENRVVVTVMRG